MRHKNSLKKHLPLPVMIFILLLFINPSIKGETTDREGVFILSHDEITGSGARNLADLLVRLPGVQLSTNSVQSMPSAGPLVSSDSPVRLSANQFSRVLILFNGHPLNKNWYGGADQEWGTGFLEGLKEVRVYTGPAAMARNGWNGGMEMVIDLVPFTGTEQDGAIDIRLTQSFNEDRADKSMLHLRTGNRWGENGSYSFFADVTRWSGADVIEGWDASGEGERMDRKDPTFQAGAVIEKGPFALTARHLQHYLFDPNNCGRKWSYTFVEGSRTVEFPARWEMKITAGADSIISRWGAASSAEGEALGDWDKVTEFRVSLRVGWSREYKNTSVFVGGDFQNVRLDGGPDRSGDLMSVMNFSSRRNMGGGNLRLIQQLSDTLSLRGAVRIEKVEGYDSTAVLPEVSLYYKRGGTAIGLSYAVGHRYMDSWFRVGSSGYSLSDPSVVMPYIIPVELKPERNEQLKARVEFSIGSSWVIEAAGFIGKYSHLMGLDWDYTLEQGFGSLRAADTGDYSYWGGSGSVSYKSESLRAGANVSFQGVYDSRLLPRQLYLSEEGDRPLFLSPVTANFFLDWHIFRHLTLSAHFRTSGSARNAGVDLSTFTLDTVFNAGIFTDTPSYSSLDFSIRLMNIWKNLELQFTVHNALNDHARLSMLEGGTFLTRGRELTLTLRHKF